MLRSEILLKDGVLFNCFSFILYFQRAEMVILNLLPSEIRFTQDSIGRLFGRGTNHASQPIGELLDDLLLDRCSVDTIPKISVMKFNNKYYSADNRRLWIFKKAEEFGKCDSIQVCEIDFIPAKKLTTQCDGLNVHIRGNPGGRYWRYL
ncbi:hypothetical protein KUTeg_012347 [Tegillarca granosa]|uniref:Uncharacterized protein n=1 Tax=Tegillarca granosa TaxID=220873 RepID=A0ABQ9F3L0_TEGGR|nr:hypothetical protein KUTeg_012347 [Tegillarca granosa]